ncbi:hypothetical protein HYT91_02375 [Candidatus Pacearchaeota archaeon]|nr:hypothetical protein [Candidatus Pacearchaeota archaeon]
MKEEHSLYAIDSVNGISYIGLLERDGTSVELADYIIVETRNLIAEGFNEERIRNKYKNSEKLERVVSMYERTVVAFHNLGSI